MEFCGEKFDSYKTKDADYQKKIDFCATKIANCKVKIQGVETKLMQEGISLCDLEYLGKKKDCLCEEKILLFSEEMQLRDEQNKALRNWISFRFPFTGMRTHPSVKMCIQRLFLPEMLSLL